MALQRGIAGLESEPFEVARQVAHREVDLQYSAPRRSGGQVRCMQNQRHLQPHIAALGETGDRAASFDDRIDLRLGDPAKPMRTRRDQ